MQKLNENEVTEKLVHLKNWSLDNNKIMKEFEFNNFVESVDFINKIVPLAEEMNHHPDIQINYNKVTVSLITHDKGGITENDFQLAEKIENLSV